MRKKILQLLLLMALGLPLLTKAQEKLISREETITETQPEIINGSDTIVVREVITRTDIIHRTEKIVRYSDTIPAITGKNIAGDGTYFADTLSRPGGHYVWIPDSLNERVGHLLEGKLNLMSVPDKDMIDLGERVLFRGDTIPMILKDRNLGRFDRGLFNYLFIPKGIWQIGLTASYGEFSTEDLQVLDLVSDIDFYGHLFSIRPYFSYFIKNNISVGMRLGYTSGKAKIGSFNVDIDEDMSFNLHDIQYKSESYTAALTFSQYLGIARRGRFGFFNEVELAFSSGSSDFHRPFNGEMRKTHTTSMEAALNFSPGLCVYILDQLSFNVSFGVFGLNVRHDKQTENGQPIGSRTTSGANFRFNIFNINFGIAVNI